MIKFAGALFLVVSGCLAGCAESRRLRLRAEKLEAFLRFLAAAKTEIRYSASTVEKVVRDFGGSLSFLSQLDGAEPGTWRQAWREAVASGARKEGFSREDLGLLYGFGEGFGASDTEGQLAHLSLYEDLTAAAMETARSELSRKARLYRMLGLFGGAAAAILFC